MAAKRRKPPPTYGGWAFADVRVILKKRKVMISKIFKKLFCSGEKIYLSKDEPIAFIYYDGSENSCKSAISFIERYAPDVANEYYIRTINNKHGIFKKGTSFLNTNIYICAKSGKIELIKAECIEFLFGDVRYKI